MSEINRSVAAKLWDALTVSVDRMSEKLIPREKSTFLGFVDVTIDATAVLPGFKLKLRGIGVKILKGSPYLDMPSEKGADGTWYPRYFPLTGELREVLTIAIFKDSNVDSAMQRGAALAVGNPDGEDIECASEENPFSA